MVLKLRTHHFLCSGENRHTPVDQSGKWECEVTFITSWETECFFLFALLKNLFEEVVEL